MPFWSGCRKGDTTAHNTFFGRQAGAANTRARTKLFRRPSATQHDRRQKRLFGTNPEAQTHRQTAAFLGGRWRAIRPALRFIAHRRGRLEHTRQQQRFFGTRQARIGFARLKHFRAESAGQSTRPERTSFFGERKAMNTTAAITPFWQFGRRLK